MYKDENIELSNVVPGAGGQIEADERDDRSGHHGRHELVEDRRAHV